MIRKKFGKSSLFPLFQRGRRSKRDLLWHYSLPEEKGELERDFLDWEDSEGKSPFFKGEDKKRSSFFKEGNALRETAFSSPFSVIPYPFSVSTFVY